MIEKDNFKQKHILYKYTYLLLLLPSRFRGNVTERRQKIYLSQTNSDIQIGIKKIRNLKACGLIRSYEP